MVSFHFLEIELTTTNCTSVTLFFPYRQLDVFWKSTQIETMFIACEHIRDNSLFPLHFTITNKY